MLENKIREATRFLTERQESGGIMSPDDDAGKPQGKTVMEVLLSKHPDQINPDEEAFVECEELPIFLDVEITSSHGCSSSPSTLRRCWAKWFVLFFAPRYVVEIW